MNTTAAPKTGVWTPWNGAPATGPKLPPGTLIRYRARCGVSGQAAPHGVQWNHAHGMFDVVAYMVLPTGVINEGALTCKPIDHRVGGWQ